MRDLRRFSTRAVSMIVSTWNGFRWTFSSTDVSFKNMCVGFVSKWNVEQTDEIYYSIRRSGQRRRQLTSIFLMVAGMAPGWPADIPVKRTPFWWRTSLEWCSPLSNSVAGCKRLKLSSWKKWKCVKLKFSWITEYRLSSLDHRRFFLEELVEMRLVELFTEPENKVQLFQAPSVRQFVGGVSV